MRLKSGDYAGELVEVLVLTEPNLVLEMLDQPDSDEDPVCQEIRRLIEIFDAKPFKVPCATCGGEASLVSLYANSVQAQYWCKSCAPIGSQTTGGKLKFIQAYMEVAAFVHLYCGGRKADLSTLIRKLGRAKGLPLRIRAFQAEWFFRF